MTPWLILVVLVSGLLVLIPTRRLSQRTDDPWVVALYFVATWLIVAAIIAVPGVRRAALPLVLLLAVAPWVSLPAGLLRLIGRGPGERRPPPRNVTPPDA